MVALRVSKPYETLNPPPIPLPLPPHLLRSSRSSSNFRHMVALSPMANIRPHLLASSEYAIASPCSSSSPFSFPQSCGFRAFRDSSPSSRPEAWSCGGRRRSWVLKVESRAGGYRPPPGARKPKPNLNRQQQQAADDEAARDRLPVNQEITSPTVMLLGEDGKLVGTMTRQEALYRAQEQELDLVQLDKQDPPCVKIVQYSKLKYELQKRKKEQQKKSSASKMDLKELKMRYNIDVHDYGVRLRSVQRFLKDGDKVKLIIQFKGRELEFKDLGLKLFQRFEDDLKEEAIVESKLTKDPRSMTMVLTSSKGKSSGQSPNTTPKTSDDEDNKNVEAEAVTTVGAAES